MSVFACLVLLLHHFPSRYFVITIFFSYIIFITSLHFFCHINCYHFHQFQKNFWKCKYFFLHFPSISNKLWCLNLVIFPRISRNQQVAVFGGEADPRRVAAKPNSAPLKRDKIPYLHGHHQTYIEC